MFTSLLDFLLLKQWIPVFIFLKLRLAPVHKSRYKTPASANKDRILVKSFMCVQVSVTLLPTSSGILFPSFLEEADAVPDVVSLSLLSVSSSVDDSFVLSFTASAFLLPFFSPDVPEPEPFSSCLHKPSVSFPCFLPCCPIRFFHLTCLFRQPFSDL